VFFFRSLLRPVCLKQVLSHKLLTILILPVVTNVKLPVQSLFYTRSFSSGARRMRPKCTPGNAGEPAPLWPYAGVAEKFVVAGAPLGSGRDTILK